MQQLSYSILLFAWPAGSAERAETSVVGSKRRSKEEEE
jgi:hypothetical protein